MGACKGRSIIPAEGNQGFLSKPSFQTDTIQREGLKRKPGFPSASIPLVLKILSDVRSNDSNSGRMNTSRRQSTLELHKCRVRMRKLRNEIDTERDLIDDFLIDIADGLDRMS